ncbi:hypothetical protein [Vibrio genomosp. F10]|uniref:hypothetical protein n=1 Tax=Vibrio genomosp. F10 TaxID=723171 RepID=UPI0002FC7C07|nr:hypothetical protein [Vibrio genomosp. F10]OEF09525.1 hypothetical protein A1QI_13830 [Vibrio genomosp. F10 str. 9ZB36]
MTKKKTDVGILEMLENVDKASEGAALVENDHVNPIKIERDRSRTKGNNKLLTNIPETLVADFYLLKASGDAKGYFNDYIIEALIEKTDRDLEKKEKKQREQV